MKASDLLQPPANIWFMGWRWFYRTELLSKEIGQEIPLSHAAEWMFAFAPKHIRHSGMADVTYLSDEALAFLKTEDAACMIKLYHESE